MYRSVHTINIVKNNLFLTNEYNKIRINELQKVDLVINLSTTFVFDAALYQLPIVQLYFLANIEYPFFTNIHKQIHLAHLLKHKDLLFTINDKIPVKYQLKKYFDEKDLLLEKSRAFSRRLRTWIMPSETMDQAVTRVVDKILK